MLVESCACKQQVHHNKPTNNKHCFIAGISFKVTTPGSIKQDKSIKALTKNQAAFATTGLMARIFSQLRLFTRFSILVTRGKPAADMCRVLRFIQDYYSKILHRQKASAVRIKNRGIGA